MQLCAVDGLVHILEIKSQMRIKEYVVAGLWLLACDAKNAARITMHGGVPLLVGFVLYPFEKAYVPIRTLAVGALLQLVETSADVCNLVAHFTFGESLLQVWDEPCDVFWRR